MKMDKVKKIYIDRGKIYFASLELTQNCNFKCNHCYCTDSKSENLSIEQYKKIIDKLHSIGCFLLIFTGGEILTHKHFIEIYTYAKDKGFIIDLMTNGSMINEEIIQLLKNLRPNNIVITMYGTNEEEYEKFTGNASNFNKFISGLELLHSNNIPFALRTVASKTFYKSIKNFRFEEIADKFKSSFRYDPIIFPKTSGDRTPLNESLDINEIIELDENNPLRKLSWTKIIQEEETFNWKCRAGENSLAIDHKGNAFVCGLYRNNPISIIENDIELVLKHLNKVHKEHINIINTNECSNCSMRKICKWCPAYSFVYNKNETEKIPFFCRLAEERMKKFKHEE